MQQQKMLMYVFPIIFAVMGINFPVGVLVYWLTTNVWSMGQQLIVIRNNPTPGSKAFAERQARLKKAGRLNPDGSVRKAPWLAALTGGNKQPAATAEAVVAETVQVRRQQPRKQSKAQRHQAAGHHAQTAGGEHAEAHAAEEHVADEPVVLSKQDAAVPAGRSAAKQPAGKTGPRQQPKRGGQGSGQRPKKKS
jgi:YidC/Oxa1 family membrane protein insertase